MHCKHCFFLILKSTYQHSRSTLTDYNNKLQKGVGGGVWGLDQIMCQSRNFFKTVAQNFAEL